MDSFYLYDNPVERILAYHIDKQIIGMFDPSENNTTQRIYVENAGQTNGSDNGYFIYIYVNNVKKYFSVSPEVPYDPKIPDDLRYTLILKDKESDPQLLKRQWWIFKINLKFTDGYFSIFPCQIIRTNLELNFAHNNGRDAHYVYISYDTTGTIKLINCDSLTAAQQKEMCTLLNDNRLYTIVSSNTNGNTMFYLNTDNPVSNLILSSSNVPNPGFQWRLECTNHQFHTFSGTYYIVIPDPNIPSTGEDKMLSSSGSNISIVANDTSDNAKWQFIFVSGTDEYLIKNVASGKILIINSASNGFEMSDSYDCNESLINTESNRKKRWKIISANKRIKE